MTTREIAEGEQEQGSHEEITYTLTTTRWGSSPTSPEVKVYSVDEDANPNTLTEVTNTIMPSGSPSILGDVISLPKALGMTAGTLYRVDIAFTISNNKLEAYGLIRCTR